MPFTSVLLLIIAMLSVQSGAALAKQLFPLVGPGGMTLLRTSLGALILLGVWRPWTDVWSLQKLKRVGLYGCSLGLMNLLFYLSLQYVPLGIAVALEFTGPLTLAILSSRRLLDFLWALLAGLGILLLLPIAQIAPAALDYRGVFFSVGAGVFWALYIVFGKRAGEDSHGGKTAAVGMVFAALVTFPFGAVNAAPALWRWQILPVGAAVAVLSSALPFSLEMMALKKIPVRTFGILMSLEPVLAVVVGSLVLREFLAFNQIMAIGCIVIASLGSSLTSQDSVTPPP